MEKMVSLLRPDLMEVVDADSGDVFCGSDQKWYPTAWQRLSGCGPSVAANILLYYCRKSRGSTGICDRSALLSLMNEAWKYVTPTVHGIPTTELFIKRIESYGAAHGRPFVCHSLNIPAPCDLREPFSILSDFIVAALGEDAPIAFLNRDCGKETRIYSWHWVTIVAFKYEPDSGRGGISFFDEGVRKEADLSLWFNTTNAGGGLVYFK